MSKSMKYLVLTIDNGGSKKELEELAESYPKKQTQVLVLTIDDALRWVEFSLEMLGEPSPEFLRDNCKWLHDVEQFLTQMRDEADSDEELSACRQGADDGWYGEMESLREQFPGYEDGPNNRGAVRRAVERLAELCIENVLRRLGAVQLAMMGDLDILATLERYSKGQPVFHSAK